MHLTRLGWLVGMAGVAIATGCGEGRVIFNVDVFSFGVVALDTIPYGAPSNSSDSVSTTPLKITLPGGLGNATVESARITLGANLVNSTGAGNDSILLFFAADSASVYAGTPKFSLGGPVDSGATTPVLDSVDLVGDPLFNQDKLWMGLRIRATNTSNVAMSGKFVLSKLWLRIVLQDNLFH